MKTMYKKITASFGIHSVCLLVLIIMLSLQGCSKSTMKPWHTVKLSEELGVDHYEEVKSFDDYLQLEKRLFAELDEKIYAINNPGKEKQLERYLPGTAADFHNSTPDWNRSFELEVAAPKATVLLLHGMSDSPYSLKAIGEALHKKNYQVIGLRMPGHGTIPSGLRYLDRQDMTKAVRLAAKHLAELAPQQPFYIIGYSTGAALAIEYALDSYDSPTLKSPDKLVLISPAIGVHAAAGFASFKNSLAIIPGLDSLAYLQIMSEFDPYKYNSFATNAASVVHSLTRSNARRIRERANNNPDILIPETLVFKSTVDFTVSNRALLDNLFDHVKSNRHELVLFDINRFHQVRSNLIVDDPAPFTDRIMNTETLPFTVSLITNKNPSTRQLVKKTKAAMSSEVQSEELALSWPPSVISLSHVALPVSPEDSLYGENFPEDENALFLGQMALLGERGLLNLPAEWLLRLRYNPFYEVIEKRTLEWLEP